jgi:hypothetical protein
MYLLGLSSVLYTGEINKWSESRVIWTEQCAFPSCPQTERCLHMHPLRSESKCMSVVRLLGERLSADVARVALISKQIGERLD